MRISRHFTEAGKDIYAEIGFRRTTSEIRSPDGSVVFRAEDRIRISGIRYRKGVLSPSGGSVF